MFLTLQNEQRCKRAKSNIHYVDTRIGDICCAWLESRPIWIYWIIYNLTNKIGETKFANYKQKEKHNTKMIVKQTTSTVNFTLYFLVFSFVKHRHINTNQFLCWIK